MADPEGKTDAGSKRGRARIGLVLFAFIVLAGLWFHTGGRFGPASSGTGQGLAATRPAAQSKPTPTTGITTEAARRWQPPKFTERRRERDAMVSVIRRYGLKDKAVLATMAAVPRHEFVTKRYLSSEGVKKLEFRGWRCTGTDFGNR